MESVFPVEINVSSSSINLSQGRRTAPSSSFGVVEKIIEPGKFIVSLADGHKLNVVGSKALKLGSLVQVQQPSRIKGTDVQAGTGRLEGLGEKGLQWSANIPLGFGGKGAKARIEVFVERATETAWNKVAPAIYFVMVVQTNELGEIQWSIYMKGRQVALQVFAPDIGDNKKGLRDLIMGVEKGLKSKGLVMMAPTVFLTRPFKVPAGFRLNVRG